MSRDKRIPDHLTLPVESGQLARWQAAALLRADSDPADLTAWILPLLDAAADYERAVGGSAAELLQMMIPVPLRPLLRAPDRRNGNGAGVAVPASPANTASPPGTDAAAPSEDLLPAADAAPAASSRVAV